MPVLKARKGRVVVPKGLKVRVALPARKALKAEPEHRGLPEPKEVAV